MAIQSLTDLKALINSTIQDNTTNDISGSDVQTALINAIDTLDSLEGFINVHKANGQTTITAYGSKALARAAVPDDCKKEGVVIAYKISTGWLIEQNLDATAGTWGDDTSWQTIGPVSVSQNTLTIGGEEKGELAGQLIENPEWVQVVTDSEDKILYGVKTDGKFYFGDGCPPQVQEYVKAQIDAIGIDALLATKVDKVTGKSLIDADFASSQSTTENPEYIKAETDSEGKLLAGRTSDGAAFEKIGFRTPKMSIDDVKINNIENPEWVEVVTDANGKVIKGITKDGVIVVDRVRILEEERNKTEFTGLIRDIPKNRGVLNAYKKIQQLVNLKWIALSNPHDMYNTPSTIYPRLMDSIPYSEVVYTGKYVGMSVSIHTFMTAAHNPHSLLYTENLNGQNPTSDYGLHYEPYDGYTYVGSYYGDVCNTFVLYCLGIHAHYYINVMRYYLPKIGILEPVYGNTAADVELMDILWEPGHCSIISDIYRNDRGEVKKLYLSEDSGLIVSNLFSTEGLQERMNRNGGILFRYKYLYQNLDYKPSVYSPVEDEELPQPYYNNDICTFAGDKASFVTGNIIYLNYNKGDYADIEIFDISETLINTLHLDSDASIHRCDLTSLNLTYGTYKARLTDGVNSSDYTYFEILDTSVSYEKVGDKHKFYFSSQNSTPDWLAVCVTNGEIVAVVQLNDEDRNNGYVMFNLKELSLEEYLTGPNSYHRWNIEDLDLYVRVYFEGEYGTPSSDLLSIEL